MSSSAASIRRKLDTAGDLQSVVRTMKAVSAANIGRYEQSVRALGDYYHTVELGLGACFRARRQGGATPGHRRLVPGPLRCIVFGSDQGLVGQFNDVITDYAMKTLATLPGTPQGWAVGERVQARLLESGLTPEGMFAVPVAVEAIAPLVGQIQLALESQGAADMDATFYVFHNRPLAGALYEPVGQRLLPMDARWQQALMRMPWPTRIPPEILGSAETTLRALIREYLYLSLYRACAESLASENASRLAAMQRAEKNIDELLAQLRSSFHQLRQSSIDEELFDVVAGYGALEQE